MNYLFNVISEWSFYVRQQNYDTILFYKYLRNMACKDITVTINFVNFDAKY